MGTTRLEAFSDGVLAIAATLLVLELHVPEVGSDVAGALTAQWLSYAAYVVSFLTIGIIWVNHHGLFAHVRRVDRQLLFLNLFLLLTVSLIPFPTALVGRHVADPRNGRVVAAIYGAVMVLMSVAFTLLWRHVTGDATLLGAHLDPRRARRESLLFSAGLVGYLTGVAVAFVSAYASLALYALVAVFYLFPWLPEASPAGAEPPAAGEARRP